MDTGVTSQKVRWILPFVLLVTLTIAYLDRLNLAIALPKITDEFGWTVAQTGEYGGLLISIFFVGYGLTNMLLSPLAEKIGPRKSLLTIIVLFSFFTAITAPLASFLTAFIAVRFLLGVGEGVHFPMMSLLTKNWFPVKERSRANGIWVSGVMFSTILAPLLLVPVIEWIGWRGMFIFLGVLGVGVSIPLVWLFVYNNPRTHPKISAEEIGYIESGMEKDEKVREGTFWQEIKPIARDKIYWIALMGGILNNFASYGLMMWFPLYFNKSRGVEFSSLKYAVSIPYMSAILGIICVALISDKLQRRVLIAGIGYVITGILGYFACTASSITTTIALFSVAIFFQMSYTTNEFAILQRILPKNKVATGTGFYNGLAMLIGGGLGPVVVGQVIAYTKDYTSGILTLVAFSLIAGFNMLVLSRFLKY
jgi:sugar phosphate permease